MKKMALTTSVNYKRSDRFAVVGFVLVGGGLLGEDVVVVFGSNSDSVLWPAMVVTTDLAISSMTSCGGVTARSRRKPCNVDP
ncbi:hypothetical protein Tco_0957762 [Tanacetum coccineum]